MADASAPAPAKRSRTELIRTAYSCVDAIDARMRQRRRGILHVGRGELSIARALYEVLAVKLASRLEATEAPIVGERTSSLRRYLYSSRQKLLRPVQRARGLASWPAPRADRPDVVPVLMVPRRWTHLRDLMPIARQAESTGRFSCWWLAFKEKDLVLLREQGHRAVLVDCFAPSSLEESLRLRVDLALERLDRTSGRPASVDQADWDVALDTMFAEFDVLVGPLRIEARAISRVFHDIAPKLVVVGSPRTSEGALSIAAARADGIPTLSVQHGQIGLHEEYAECGTDLLAAWGPRSRETLMKLGLPAERIVVTGAPWMDDWARDEARISRDRAEKRQILVALSGAGQSVGMDEHLAQVRRLMVASQSLSSYEWVYRLHQKDHPEIYRRMLAELPGSRGTIIDPRVTEIDIHDQLAGAAVLITVNSTAAVDAMLHHVPVVTLGRPPAEPISAPVQAGATTHSPIGDALEDTIQRVLTRGQDEATKAGSRRYLGEFFGELDGGASRRVVEAMLELISREPRRAA